jgi:hypothetical protein
VVRGSAAPLLTTAAGDGPQVFPLGIEVLRDPAHVGRPPRPGRRSATRCRPRAADHEAAPDPSATSTLLPSTANRQWLRDKILIPLGYRRTDCWITDCLDTARLNPDQQRRIRETYLPVGGRLGLPTPNMESTPSGDRGIVREAQEGHLERLSRELDTARPELFVTLGNAALRVLRLLVEIDAGDPGRRLPRPDMEPKRRCGSVHARSDGSRSCTHGPASEYRSGARSICAGWTASSDRVPSWRLLTLSFPHGGPRATATVRTSAPSTLMRPPSTDDFCPSSRHPAGSD